MGDGKDIRDWPIGVFDSGLGGLTVVRELQAELPDENILYLADNARVPYGTKSLETVRRLAMEDAAFLVEAGIKMLVVACNSASAAASDHLQRSWPLPVVDVIVPGASAALIASTGAIGLIGTSATVRSGAYQRAVRNIEPRRQVDAVPCPLLVPIVEEARALDDRVVRWTVQDYLAPFTNRRLGSLIMGCTHYPLLEPVIRDVLGDDVVLVNPGKAAAAEVKRQLAQRNLAKADSGQARGWLRCFATDDAERFAILAERFGVQVVYHVEQLRTEELHEALVRSGRA